MLSFFNRLKPSLRVLAIVFFLIALPLHAQRLLSVPRADGRVTPLRLYPATGSVVGCTPLAVISHGAGGSENGYRYLAKAMSQLGFTAIVMGHRESDRSALRGDILRYGLRRGVRKLVTDRQAEEDRLLDVGATLEWAESQCKSPYRVLLGHSMGSVTVMLEAGAINMIGVVSPPAGQDRFDAYVALSPEGPGIVFPDRAWSGIHKPLLALTGTRDQALQGGPQSRQIPWHELPGGVTGCQWMGVLDGATHMDFAGVGFWGKACRFTGDANNRRILERSTQWSLRASEFRKRNNSSIQISVDTIRELATLCPDQTFCEAHRSKSRFAQQSQGMLKPSLRVCGRPWCG